MLNILLILPRAEYIGLYIAGAFFDPIVGLIVGAGHLYKSKQYIPLDILIYNWPASPVHPWAGCGKTSEYRYPGCVGGLVYWLEVALIHADTLSGGEPMHRALL